jgi:hypothetical protein
MEKNRLLEAGNRRNAKKFYRELRVSQSGPEKPEGFYPGTENAIQKAHLFSVKHDKRKFAKRPGAIFRENRWIST